MNNPIRCNSCSKIVPNGKFCPECGALLGKKETENKAVTPVKGFAGLGILNGIKTQNNQSAGSASSSKKKAPSDEGLTLLVNCCHKTVATVGGDGYSEAVLYHDEKNDTYSVHTYSKYEYMASEEHHAYKADKAFRDKVYSVIEKTGIERYDGYRGCAAMCGAMEICKFRNKEGKIIRITGENLTMDNYHILGDISSVVYSAVREGNEIIL